MKLTVRRIENTRLTRYCSGCPLEGPTVPTDS
jgi:hypothetical protein